MTISTARIICIASLLLASPVMAQKVYKCPGPDGKAVYQQKRCAEGSRMYVQDNGSGSGGSEPAATTPSASSTAGAAPGSGLREGEKAMLDDVKRREEAARKVAVQRQREQEQAESAAVQREFRANLKAERCSFNPYTPDCQRR